MAMLVFRLFGIALFGPRGHENGTDFAAAWRPQKRCRFKQYYTFYQLFYTGGRKIGPARRPRNGAVF